MSVLGTANDLTESFIAECAGQLRAALSDLIQAGSVQPGGLIVVGCSTSEAAGNRIGTKAYPALGYALAEAATMVCTERKLYLAAQCCEHLNRALVVSREYQSAQKLDRVLAVPTPQAGGSFAAAVYQAFNDPTLVERIQADAGLDIGGTLIGMHLRRVAVPLRLSAKEIGLAHVTAATTRPPYTGGPRAQYP